MAKSELAELDAKRRHLLWKVSEYSGLLTEIDGSEAAEEDHSTSEKPYKELSAAETMRSILTTMGKPLTMGELARLAISGGYGGTNAVVSKVVPNFSSSMSRSLKSSDSPFVKLKRGLIDLRGRESAAEEFDSAITGGDRAEAE